MELNPLLRRAVELGASDIHLKVGLPPILRRDGALGPLDEAPVLSDRDAESVLEVVGKRSPERLEAFKSSGDLDIAYQEDDLPRFAREFKEYLNQNTIREIASLSAQEGQVPWTRATSERA